MCGCGHTKGGVGYGVRLARPIDGDVYWCIGREHLVPLTPPDGQVDEHAGVGLGVEATA